MAPPPSSPADPRRVWARHGRTVGAVAVLLWLGAPAWPRQIDDQFITLAFAHNWAIIGQIRWGTGELVEACSSFVQLVLATVAVLAGLDANLFVKRLALLCGAGIVAFAAARFPRGAAGGLLLAAIATWDPLAYWSMAGMETTLYAALLTLGWVGVAGGTPGPVAGLGLLWLSAPTHPEGNVHFLLAAAFVARRPGPGRIASVGLLLALVAWHALRVRYFGAWWPTPYLVKIAASDPFGAQWGRVGYDLACSAGILGIVFAAFPLRPALLAPLAIQAGLALRAEADWMGHARQLLPGVLATAVAIASTTAPRALGRLPLAGLALLVVTAGAFVPPGVENPSPILRALPSPNPWRWLRSALDTPQGEDIDWLVTHAPRGSAVMLEDVGMPGNIVDLRVLDMVGLTDRTMARAMLGDDSADAALRDRLAASPPALVRRMRYAGDDVPRPVPWLKLPSPIPAAWPQGTALLYTLDDRAPSRSTILGRWAALHQRYPAQGPIAWRLAMAMADNGELVEATALSDRMQARFPSDGLLAALGAALFFPFPAESFAEVPDRLRQFSRAIPRKASTWIALSVLLDPPAEEGQLVTIGWDCGGESERVVIDGRTLVPLPVWTCAGAEARVRVEAIDDRPRRPLPTRMYVGLTSPE